MSVAELNIQLNDSEYILNNSFDGTNFDYLNNVTYKPGQTIKGSVLVKVVSHGVCAHDGIVLSIEGTGEFRWSGHNEGGEDIFHQYKTKYLAVETVLSREELGVGLHAFPFEFELPPNLPASFFSSETTPEVEYYGEIFYEIRAIMKRSFKFNPEASVQFQVKDVAPDCSIPVNTVTFKNIRTGFGNIAVVLNCPLKEFTPDSCLQFTASFCNNSLKKILSTTVSLVQCTRYYGMEGNLRHLKIKKVFSLNGCSIESGQADVMAVTDSKNYDFHIPLDVAPPLSKSKGRILDISYYFLMTLDVMDMEQPLKVMIPTTSVHDDIEKNDNSLGKIPGIASKFSAVGLKQR